MILLYSKWLQKLHINGITLFPFVILRKKELNRDKVLLYHEKIHLRQQLEMLIIPFYIWYIIEFMIRYIQKNNGNLAYLSISFEKEAYHNAQDFSYLQKRRFWAFLNYL